MANDEEPDLIVVGARGHSMLDDLLVGSVARGDLESIPFLASPCTSPED